MAMNPKSCINMRTNFLWQTLKSQCNKGVYSLHEITLEHHFEHFYQLFLCVAEHDVLVNSSSLNQQSRVWEGSASQPHNHRCTDTAVAKEY
jgi:hypothetical protein